MDKYELAAKVSKYVAVVATVFCMSKFGFSVNFNKESQRPAVKYQPLKEEE